MSELSITGKLKTLLPAVGGTSKAGKEWKKQEFIVSNNEGYEGKEQIFCFEVFGEEKVENLTKFNKVGDLVTVSFNINTNEWNDKYFTSLSAWLIKKVESSGEVPPVPIFEPAGELNEDNDDLPF